MTQGYCCRCGNTVPETYKVSYLVITEFSQVTDVEVVGG